MSDRSSGSERNLSFHDVRGDMSVESIGPFESYPVVINGWSVPRLEMRQLSDHVEMVFDGRFGLDLPNDRAGIVAEFIANVIAVERGYTCHPQNPRPLTPPTEAEMKEPIPPRQLPWKHMVPLSAVADESILDHKHEDQEREE